MLSPKRSRFVREYLRDQNATQAAIRAGYSRRSARQQGARLMANAAIRAAVERRSAKVAASAELSREKVLRDLEMERAGAVDSEQWHAAIRATELQGRELRMFAERHEIRAGLELVFAAAREVLPGALYDALLERIAAGPETKGLLPGGE